MEIRVKNQSEIINVINLIKSERKKEKYLRNTN